MSYLRSYRTKMPGQKLTKLLEKSFVLGWRQPQGKVIRYAYRAVYRKEMTRNGERAARPDKVEVEVD